MYNLSDAYGLRLGDALEGNTHVSSISLRLCNALAADEGVDSAARLLRYISESVSMRKIELTSWRDPRRPEVVTELLRLAVRAIAESSHIEELLSPRFGTFGAPPDEIALLLRTTRSLKALSIRLNDFGVASRELVAEAFGANRTLECLEFQDRSSAHTVEAVLLHLGPHPRLRVLTLCCYETLVNMTQIHALHHFLRTTISLEELELPWGNQELELPWGDDSDEKECMECLIEGLQSSRSLVKLTFKGRLFNLDAMKLFHDFMHTGGTRSSIRKLSFRMNWDRSAAVGRAAAALLTLPETHHMGSCIAASLQVLDFDDDIAGFYDTLAANASRIRLPCVHHAVMSDDFDEDWEALVRCLPKLVYLRELRISVAPRTQEDIWGRSFVDAMQQNGSLRDVDIENGTDDPVFDDAQERQIQSYCKRNKAIPTLVANPRPDAMAIALFPKLFVAAKQARRTAPNAILLGLLAAGDAIGPRRDKKRPHQQPSD